MKAQVRAHRAARRVLLCGGLLVLAGGPLQAVDPEKPLSELARDLWTVDDGLPQGSVETALQSSEGYLWLGTQEGLVRFDGLSFEVFDHRNTAGMPNPVVNALAEAGDGSLWVGTGNGLVRFRDGVVEEAVGTALGLRGPVVGALLVDPAGFLWVGTRRNGALHRYEHGRLERVLGVDGEVWDLARDRDGTLWVATGEGLLHLIGNAVQRFFVGSDLPPGEVRAVTVDRTGTVWVGTRGGLHRLEAGRFVPAAAAELGGTTVNRLLADGDDCLWVGTNGRGLARLRGDRLEWLGPAEGLPGGVIRSIASDREGSLWFGVWGAGLCRLKEASFAVLGRRDGLSSDHVTAVLEDRAGDLWVATLGGGLNRLHDGGWTALTTADGLPSDLVWSLAEDRHGALWVGTYGEGLCRLREGKLTAYGAAQGLDNPWVRVILEDRSERLWVGTRVGLYRLEAGGLSRAGLPGDLAELGVTCLLQDRSGTLWVGTSGSGLRGLTGDQLVSYTETDGLARDWVYALHEDADGTLWVATSGGGLSRLRDGRLASLSTAEGLFDETAYQILEDAEGDLWLSSNRGVARVGRAELEAVLDGRAERVTPQVFGRGDGFRTPECNGGSQPAGWRGRDGRLWWPTMGGVAVVDPRHLVVNRIPPQVRVEQVRVDGRVVPASPQLMLEPGTRAVELRFAALSLRDPQRVRVVYQLERFDPDWVEAGSRRAAFYTNLPSGHYRFRVRACNEHGVWSQDEAVTTLVQAPYWYQNWWFVALATAGLAAAMVLIYQARARSAKARERELETRVAEAVTSLRASEARLAEAHRVAGLGAWEWVVDTDELIWSEQMYRLHRRDPARGPMHDFWLQSVDPEDRAEVSNRLDEASHGGRPYSVDHRIRCDDGAVRWVHAEAEVSRSQDGQPVRLVGTVVDITDRVLQEEERRRLETQLLEAQKMESLGLLAGGVAHDFNNLLMTILGNTDLARLRLPEGSAVSAQLDGIEAASRRAADLAAQMLAYAGRGRTKVERADLSALVADMAHLLRAAIPDRGVLHCRLEPELPAVEADLTQLRQVVMNLILNAAESLGPDGGEIVLQTQAVQCDESTLKRCHLGEELPAGRYVVLEVADGGCGMDEGTVARIFDPFFSTKFAGRGLGLAAVLGIVRSHRGAIQVRSQQGRGTVMRVLLPCAAGPPKPLAPAQPPETEWRGTGTVMVVDDDEMVRRVAGGLLESLGFEVLQAEDGLEAVALFRQHQERVGLVLLDLAMPRLDGVGALRELRRIRPEARVILCSGYGDAETQARFGAGANEPYLEKPFTLARLRSKVRAVLEG